MLAICDGEQPIEWLAYDALAQAEHDPMACSSNCQRQRELADFHVELLRK